MKRIEISPAQKVAYSIGMVAAGVLAVAMSLPGSQSWQQSGPPNTGHAELACDDCHAPAEGNWRQQIQANVRYWMGNRASPAWFGHAPVENEQCLDCHTNENDLHPVYRFTEPRFAPARQAIGAQHCSSCHRQHQGNRVSVPSTFCSHCHENTVMQEEPAQVSHQKLIDDASWDSCMRCHDFHGNHRGRTPEVMEDALSQQQITDYFNGRGEPYGHRRLTVIQTMKVKP